MADLVRSGRLHATGIRRQRKYHVPGRNAEAPDQLAVSDAGSIVRGLIRRPLIARVPVGYVPRFLESYRQNVDAYIDPAMRTRLHLLGRTAGPNARPGPTRARS